MVKTLLIGTLAAACVTFACDVAAGAPEVGSDAAPLSVSNWVLNAPEVGNPADLKGEVVIVEMWGVNCPPCLKLIPHLIELHKEYSKKGLNIFTFEAQNHSEDEIKALMVPKGVNYPVALGSQLSGYQGDGGVPHAWVIGVEGKVMWQGNPAGGGMDAVVKTELAKVKYPGLGRISVDPKVEPAAKLFVAGEFGKARTAAEKIKGDEKASEAAIADATQVIDRVNQKAGDLKSRAETAAADRRYPVALELYDRLAKSFSGTEESDAAATTAKDLRKDKAVKAELASFDALASLRKSIEKQQATARKAALEAFAKQHEGKRAAEEAQAEAAAIK